jgi:hypothetical protein
MVVAHNEGQLGRRGVGELQSADGDEGGAVRVSDESDDSEATHAVNGGQLPSHDCRQTHLRTMRTEMPGALRQVLIELEEKGGVRRSDRPDDDCATVMEGDLLPEQS